MGYLSLNDFQRGGRHPAVRNDHRNVRPVLVGLGALARSPIPRGAGLGALAGKKSKHFAAAQAAEDNALSQIRSLQSKMDSAMQRLEQAQAALSEQQYVIEEKVAGIDNPGIFSIVSQANTSIGDANMLIEEARAAYQAFEDEFNAKKSAGGWFAVPLVAKAQTTATTLDSAISKVARAQAMVQSTAMRVQSLAAKAAKEAAAGQTAAEQAAAAEERRYQLELERQEREWQRQQQLEEQRIAREEAARQRELELQQQALERQQQLQQQEWEREEAERQRIEAAEIRRIELQQQAEERRLAMEQERILREEERELRKQEREAELQRLMLMQELAAKGLPTFAPTMPAGPVPGMYPTAVAPPGMFPMAPAPSMAMPFPGMPQMPMGPQAMPYAATPPGPAPYTQSGPLMAPQQPPPAAGMQWASFDPASEMFGMSGLVPETLNQNLQGAMIEEGWIITGPDDDDMYILKNMSTRQALRVSGDQMARGPVEYGGKVIFVPPANLRASSGKITQQDVAKGIFATLQEGIKATGSYLSERERRRAAKDSQPQVFQPMSIEYGDGGGMADRLPTWAVALGALGAGAAIFAVVSKKKAKKDGK